MQKMFRTDQLLLHHAEVHGESHFMSHMYKACYMINEIDSPVNDRQIFHP